MSEALKVLYASVEHRVGVDYCTFSELLKYWETTPLYENGELIGCVIRKENELHIGYKKKPTASIRHHLKQTLKKTLNEYGWAKTSVSIDNISGLRFCKRLGFYEINREDSKINLKCDRCKYVD